MFNVSRTFKTWRPIEYSNDICTTRFLVRNLPMGVPCQFKVAAYNNGGWGELSEESLLAIPGEEQTPLSAALRWKRLTMGGPISLMDRLDFYPKHRMEHVDGLQKILQFALQTGLKKGTIANRATLLCLRALQTFPDDPDIACSAFRMMGICLRSPKQHKKIKVILTQHGIRELCDHYSHKFRSNSAIINGIVLIRSGMMKWINPIPDIIPPEDDEDKKKGEEEDDNSTDEEEEKKGSSWLNKGTLMVIAPAE